MSASDFFLTELPPLLVEWRQKLGPRAPKASFDVEFEIDGEGMFTVVTKEGTATVRRGGAAHPVATLRFAKKTWDDALAQIIRPRLRRLAATDLAAKHDIELKRQLGGRLPVTAEAAISAMKALPLRLVLEVLPPAGHRFELAVAGAEEDDPTVTVQIAEAEIEAIFSGTLPPPEAFQQGKIRMRGAVPTAMALLSRLFIP